jgi:hypothetical protein
MIPGGTDRHGEQGRPVCHLDSGNNPASMAEILVGAFVQQREVCFRVDARAGYAGYAHFENCPLEFLVKAGEQRRATGFQVFLSVG